MEEKQEQEKAREKTEPFRFCRKCLIRDLKEDEYFKNLKEYIENLDPDIKADPALYEKRLDLCKNCNHLLQGMCRICGCFVELRAAIASNFCPGSEKFW